MLHSFKELNINVELDNCKVFDLSKFENEKIAFKSLDKNERDPFFCYDDDLDKSFSHILIFKNEIKILYEHTYGPDNNYSDLYYDILNQVELDYLNKNNLLDLNQNNEIER